MKVLAGEEDWNAIQETSHLVSIPGMRESIIEGLATPIEQCEKDPGGDTLAGRIASYTEEVNKQRQVVLYPGEDGFWVVECPSLPGCLSQGATKAEALNNIREAIDLYIESLRADGLPVPEDPFQAELVAV